ncbi:hypothetical protein Fmac_010629 [Flemingia macrophylla]|uniref:Uncharacterized protein n=1 Tax=Flemingia macrophylla TaxID=520843 RepID=A0ABD1MKY9_9FABA
MAEKHSSSESSSVSLIANPVDNRKRRKMTSEATKKRPRLFLDLNKPPPPDDSDDETVYNNEVIIFWDVHGKKVVHSHQMKVNSSLVLAQKCTRR